MKEKENKDLIFKMRITATEKQKLQEYAEKKGLTMSEAVRELCYKIFEG